MHTHIFVLFGVWKEGLLRLSVQDFSFLLKGLLSGSTIKHETNWLPSWPNEQKESSTPVTWRHSRRQAQLVSR